MGISVTVRATERQIVTVALPTPAPDVTINRREITAHLDDLLDVDLSALPQPFPGDVAYDEDERYYLNYNPSTGSWVAEREATVSEIDGGTY